MEPADTPSAPAPAAAPARADAAKRKLAEIWEEPAPIGARSDRSAPAHDSRDQGQDDVDPSTADPDAAQRALAEIWQGQPSGSDTAATNGRRDPIREAQQALIARLDRELAERAEALGSGDPKTIAAQLELAQACLAARRSQKAVVLYEQALGEVTDGDGLSQQVPHRIKLAIAHRATGNVARGVEQLQALTAELEGKPAAAEHLLAAGTELGTSHMVAGRPRDAVISYELMLRLGGELHGAEHPTTLGIRLLLARAHQQAGDSAEAGRVYEQLVSDAGTALGPGHQLTLEAAAELALVRQLRP